MRSCLCDGFTERLDDHLAEVRIENIFGNCIRVLQRNEIDETDESISLSLSLFIYYKQLAHVMREADKFHDLQGELTSWRPRRGQSLAGLKSNKTWYFHFESEGRVKHVSSQGSQTKRNSFLVLDRSTFFFF